ncbi:MAG TPA: DNA primase [Steroidobacteraceae bacterium]|nr:DNA primase [Steroidobacteraceae bacterium]
MGLIPRSFIDELIARANIIEVVGSRVALKKAGREYKACCPFHNEKTPSFWVSPEKQFYHCFGCGAHGTALSFLMEHDRLPFPEAVEELASSLGLEVPRENGAPAPRRDSATLHELMASIARFYSESLRASERARQYLARRGLDRDIIERFGIGYAPNSWNDVLRRFGTTEESRRKLAELGLIIERERSAGAEADSSSSGSGRYYDRFRDRVMFPIRDGRGRIIAFGGRVIGEGEPKYLNSPETALFHKGRELYGLYEARQSRAALTKLLVVEGYVDVVRLHQFNISCAVATLGTATTPEHLKRIFQLVPEVVFAFDGDRAGRAAAWRALQNALPEALEGREIRFLFLPEGEDPDTLVAKEGREAFERRLAADALPLSEYLVREMAERFPARGADGRARAAQAVRPLIEQVPEGIYRRLLVERLAQAFGFQRTPEGVAELLGISIGARRLDDTGRGPVAVGRGSLVRQAVRLLLHFPAAAPRLRADTVAALAQVEEPGADLLRELLADLRADPASTTAQVLERWRDRPDGAPLARLAAAEALVPDSAAAERELERALERLAEQTRRLKLDRLLEKDRAEGLSSEEKLEIQRLTKELARVPPAAAAG